MCARCEELEERVAWLEGELSQQLSDDAHQRLRNAMLLGCAAARDSSGRAGAAQLVLALYAARGRVMSRLQLMEAMPPKAGGEDERDPQIVQVRVCLARKGLGHDLIENVWGRGYRLSEVGMERVAAIISLAAPAAHPPAPPPNDRPSPRNEIQPPLRKHL